MPVFDENFMREIERNTLGLDDTFQFTCKMCGKCCKNRTEAIVMTGFDIFRIAQELGRKPLEIVQRYTQFNIGPNSHLPILTLKEGKDGRCGLNHNNRCIVQKNKPIVCAIYPLGRYYDVRDNKIKYFTQDIGKDCGKPNGKVWTLREWIETWQLDKFDKESDAWNRLLAGLSNTARTLPEEQIEDKMMLQVLLNGMYVAYDISKPYVEQVEINMKKLEELFDHLFHLELKF